MPRCLPASATLRPKVVLPVSIPPSRTIQPPVIKLSTISAWDTTVMSRVPLNSNEALFPPAPADWPDWGRIGPRFGQEQALDCTATHGSSKKSKMETAKTCLEHDKPL